ncbi:hypothetical protein BX600DRAFT_529461, partial [Xylariales sp. PMI_506]
SPCVRNTIVVIITAVVRVVVIVIVKTIIILIIVGITTHYPSIPPSSTNHHELLLLLLPPTTARSPPPCRCRRRRPSQAPNLEVAHLEVTGLRLTEVRAALTFPAADLFLGPAHPGGASPKRTLAPRVSAPASVRALGYAVAARRAEGLRLDAMAHVGERARLTER